MRRRAGTTTEQPQEDPVPDDTPEPQPINPDDLNVALLHALGLDDEVIGGCRLTIQGGAFPQLEVWHLPPNRDGHLTDDWLGPLAGALADTTTVVLPGGDREAHAAMVHQYPDPGGEEARADVAVAQLLDMLADVINGAYIDPDTRDALTARARRLAARAIRRAFPSPETVQERAARGEPDAVRRMTVLTELEHDNPPDTQEGT